MEAEARAILAEALGSGSATLDPSVLQALVADLYGGHPPSNGVDDLIKERRREALNEVIAEGGDPEKVFGDQFNRICKEAGLEPSQVRRRQRRPA